MRLHTDSELIRIETMARRHGMNPDLLHLAHCVAANARPFVIVRCKRDGLYPIAALGVLYVDDVTNAPTEEF